MKRWEEKASVSQVFFFSMYFVRNNEEMQLSFENSEK